MCFSEGLADHQKKSFAVLVGFWRFSAYTGSFFQSFGEVRHPRPKQSPWGTRSSQYIASRIRHARVLKLVPQPTFCNFGVSTLQQCQMPLEPPHFERHDMSKGFCELTATNHIYIYIQKIIQAYNQPQPTATKDN